MATLLWALVGALAGYVDCPPPSRAVGIGAATCGAIAGGTLFASYADVAASDALTACAALTFARIVGTACRVVRQRSPACLKYPTLRGANDDGDRPDPPTKATSLPHPVPTARTERNTVVGGAPESILLFGVAARPPSDS